MYEKSNYGNQLNATVLVQNPICVKTVEKVSLPIVKVLVPGIQGPASTEQPLEDDPLEIYLKARGEFSNGNSEQSD